jgi:hypothetical protein
MVSSMEGSSTRMGWKRRSSAASPSMYLRYSSSVVAPITAARRGQRRLEDVGGVHAAAGRAAPTSMWTSSMKRIASELVISSMTFFSRSSNWPRYMVPATRLPTSSISTRLSISGFGHVAVDDALGQAFDDGRLADARLTDQRRVVLGAAAENLDHALDFLLAADDRVELALFGARRQVKAQLIGERGLALLLLLVLDLELVLCRMVASSAVRTLSRLMPRLRSTSDGDAFVLAHKAEQQVLGADVVWPIWRASSTASSITRLVRGVSVGLPKAGRGLRGAMRSTWRMTSAGVAPTSRSTLTANPFSSFARPSSRCSVPT